MTDHLESEQSPTQPIRGKFVMGAENFSEFQTHLNNKPRSRRGQWFVWGVLALALIAYIWMVANGGDRDNPLIIVVIASAVTLFVVVPYIHRRSWKRNVLWQQEVSFEATPQHYEMKWGSSSETKAAWVDVDTIEQSPNQIYLWLGKTHAMILPRSAFASDAEADQLLAMARKAKENSNGA